VDAPPKVYNGDSRKILLFGLRRGGSHYYALDVTDPGKPKFLWKIGPETEGFSEMGQSWSTPQLGKVKYEKGEKLVCFIGGGYDENQDKNILMTPDTQGRAVYVVDLFTGAQLWRWDYERDRGMKYSIPSDISQVDTDGNGYIDRLYVGDTGGRLWRFDMDNPNPKSWSGRILFNTQVETTGNTRKFFYRPDVTLEDGYEMVFFGTGDRERPNEIKTINKFYAFRDIGVISTFSEKDLVDVTKGAATVQDFNNKKGWFISLERGKGEKVFAPPVVLFKVVYFSTFTPPAEKDDRYGIARIYALDYQNGGPILNLNPTNDTEKVKIDLSDRSTIIGTGVPSGTVLSVLNGKLVGFTGFQGGVYYTPLRKNATIIPMWWKEVSKK
jgi:type IV pilus assembly protein PilY1